MQPAEISTGMSGFTTDFFGALQTTFTDNSLNNSKCDISRQNPNKSQIIRQIKQQSIQKITNIWTRMIKIATFDQLYWAGVRKYRAAQKTPLNMHKHGYKIQLMFNMKNRAKLQWAFYRIQKFVQQFDMSEMPAQKIEQQQYLDELPKPKQSLKNAIQPCQKQQPNIQYNEQPNLIANIEDKSQQNTTPILNLMKTLQKLFGQKKKLKIGMQSIKNRQVYLTKKSYFIELFAHIVNNNLRMVFVNLLNFLPQNNQFGAQTIKNQKNKQIQKNQPNIKAKRQEPQIQTYGLVQNIKFKKNSRQSKCSIRSVNSCTQLNGLGRPLSGLKFNKCFKKRDLTSPDKQQESKQILASSLVSSMYKRKFTEVVNSARIQKIAAFPKILKIQTQIDQACFQNNRVFKEFTFLKKSYHLPFQQFKQEIPDIQDLMMPKQNSFAQNRSVVRDSQVNFSKRTSAVEGNKILQFSHKKHKNKKYSLQKSKRSTVKSESPQPQAVNIQSLKCYYFPEDQRNNGKALPLIVQKSNSSKFIGSPKWNGNQINKKSMQSRLRSADKINPYLWQLRQKALKRNSDKIENIANENKQNQRMMNGRSNSKNSKSSKQDKNKFQSNQQIQNNHIAKSRNISPQPQPKNKNQSSKTPPPEPTKQWCFYANNHNNIATPIRSTSQNLKANNIQFQKVTKNNNN